MRVGLLGPVARRTRCGHTAQSREFDVMHSRLGWPLPCLRAALPEILDEGVTGHLVRVVDQAVSAVAFIHRVDRAGCRARAREHFSAGRMAADHLAVYARRLVEDGR